MSRDDAKRVLRGVVEFIFLVLVALVEGNGRGHEQAERREKRVGYQSGLTRWVWFRPFSLIKAPPCLYSIST
ncbi:hypothetical protein V8C44DRAFT_314838 [Trichoderma aethiopicum]